MRTAFLSFGTCLVKHIVEKHDFTGLPAQVLFHSSAVKLEYRGLWKNWNESLNPGIGIG